MAQEQEKPEKLQVQDLINELAYQQSAGIHTFGVCQIDGCTNSARGSLRCKKHTKEELAKFITCPKASKLSMFFHHRMMIQANIDDCISDILSEYN